MFNEIKFTNSGAQDFIPQVYTGKRLLIHNFKVSLSFLRLYFCMWFYHKFVPYLILGLAKILKLISFKCRKKKDVII